MIEKADPSPPYPTPKTTANRYKIQVLLIQNSINTGSPCSTYITAMVPLAPRESASTGVKNLVSPLTDVKVLSTLAACPTAGRKRCRIVQPVEPKYLPKLEQLRNA